MIHLGSLTIIVIKKTKDILLLVTMHDCGVLEGVYGTPHFLQ